MTTQNVPPLIAALAAQVNMTPIAWHYEPTCLEPTCVVIVFEQGPKLRFDCPTWTVGACKEEKSPPLPALLPKPKAQKKVITPASKRSSKVVAQSATKH